MQYNTFAKTGEKISALGYGNMRLPIQGDDVAAIDEKKAKKLIDIAYDNGVNYFDSAWGYHGGNSEAFVGRAMADKRREDYFLATKLPVWLLEKREDAEMFFKKQMENLQTEYIDFYLFHNLRTKHMPFFDDLDLYPIMDGLRKKGYIRNLGFSFHDTPELLSKLVDGYSWDFVQIQYNYFDTDFTRASEQYQILRDRNIPIIVMEPVRGGRLADLGKQSNEILKNINPTASIASWAMRWLLDKEGILTVLSGMTTEQQLQDNLTTFSMGKPLTDAENKALGKACEIFKQLNVVPCTSCLYCMPCPKGVNIPKMFSLHNKCAYDSTLYNLQMYYKDIDEKESGAMCIGCKVCEKACPQELPISYWMRKIEADGR